jgi:hypothetical protein
MYALIWLGLFFCGALAGCPRLYPIQTWPQQPERYNAYVQDAGECLSKLPRLDVSTPWSSPACGFGVCTLPHRDGVGTLCRTFSSCTYLLKKWWGGEIDPTPLKNMAPA